MRASALLRAVTFFGFAAALILISVWFADRPGAVSLRWQGWRVDTSVAVLALGVAVVAVVAAVAYRVWVILRQAPRRLAQFHARRRRNRGYQALTRGMVAVAAGDVAEARREAKRADSLLEELPLTMLLAAQAAQLEGDEDVARKYFASMLEHPETEFLGLRGLLLQAGREGDQAQALRLAQRAFKLKPNTPWVLNSLFDLLIRKGDWHEAQDVVERAVRRGVIAREQGRRHKAIALHEQGLQAEADGDDREALFLASKALRSAPELTAAAIRLAALQIRAGKARDAARTVEKSWELTPHPELARLYALAYGDEDALARVKRFEKLLDLRPDHVESHAAMAIVALEAKLWGKSRHHLHKLMRELCDGEPSARFYRMMAKLDETEHDDPDTARRWLLRAGAAAPDETWVCRGCGAQSVEWSPLCGQCQAFDTLEWRSPLRIGTLVTDGVSGAMGEVGPETPGNGGSVDGGRGEG